MSFRYTVADSYHVILDGIYKQSRHKKHKRKKDVIKLNLPKKKMRNMLETYEA